MSETITIEATITINTELLKAKILKGAKLLLIALGACKQADSDSISMPRTQLAEMINASPALVWRYLKELVLQGFIKPKKQSRSRAELTLLLRSLLFQG